MGAQIGEIGGGGAKDNDGGPVIGFRRDPCAALGPQDDEEQGGERRQPASVPEMQIMGRGSAVLAPHMLATRMGAQ